MEAKSNAKVKMLTNLKEFYSKKAQRFDSIPVFSVLMLSVINLYDDIIALIEVADESTRGLIKMRNAHKDELFDALLLIVRPVFSYANRTGNLDLKTAMDISRYKMEQIKQEDISSWAKEIIDKATEVLQAAADYNLTQTNLTAATTKLNEWKAFLPLADLKQDEILQARALANKKLTEANLILKNQADPLVYTLENDQEIIDLWFLARKVEKASSTPTQLHLVVLSNETGTGIFDAEVEVVKPEKNIVKTTKTNPVGLAVFRPVPFGYLNVTVRCNGYTTHTIPVFKMKKGEVLHLEVRLSREMAAVV